MIYLQLFYTFLKIGLFGFGGGYAMISMIQAEVVTYHHWLTMQQFTDVVAISQMTPGPIGINSATYVGYTATGTILGAFVATFALVLPSFVLMLAISKFLMKHKENKVVANLFKGLRPAIVGLLAAAVLLLMNAENFSSPQQDSYQFTISIALFIGAFVATKWLRVSPILTIVLCGLAGFLCYL